MTSKMLEALRTFARTYRTEKPRALARDTASYTALNAVVEAMGAFVSGAGGGRSNLKVDASFGAGNAPYYTWVRAFDPRVSTGATNGFYVVLLFSDDLNQVVLSLNQGSTIATDKTIEEVTKFIFDNGTDIEGFLQGPLPTGTLVRERKYEPNNKGAMYERTNLFAHIFELSSPGIDDSFDDRLQLLLGTYGALVGTFLNQKEETTGIVPSTPECRALLTKPFLILTGVSGTGKTQNAIRLAQELALSEGLDTDDLLHVEPVGSGWMDHAPLLGYWDSLNGKYQSTQSVEFILRSATQPKLPFFLVLDEMNLSHVERYFSGMLSALESKRAIPLHRNGSPAVPVPESLTWPDNLFVIGTVNIDETTYMFSPKVLDRASVIEVRADWQALSGASGLPPLLELAPGSAQAFLAMARAAAKRPSEGSLEPDPAVWEAVLERLGKTFAELQKHNLEFGHRTVAEAKRYAAICTAAGLLDPLNIADSIILQRVLPKLNGSRPRLETLLGRLHGLFLNDDPAKVPLEPEYDTKGELPGSCQKVAAMRRALARDQFVSFIQ